MTTLVPFLILRNSKLPLTKSFNCFCNCIRLIVEVITTGGGLSVPKTNVKVIVWPSDNWPVCHGVRHPSGAQTVAGFLIWGALSYERMDLSFIFADGPFQLSHINRLWTSPAIWFMNCNANFCDGHCSVFFWLGAIAVSWLPKYPCDYCGHVFLRRIALGAWTGW